MGSEARFSGLVIRALVVSITKRCIDETVSSGVVPEVRVY